MDEGGPLRRRKSGKILRCFKSGNFNVFKNVAILRSVYILCALDLYEMLFGYFFLIIFHRGLNPHILIMVSTQEGGGVSRVNIVD